MATTSEELANKTVITNTESEFKTMSDAVVPASEVWYSYDKNTARSGDGVSTWGALVPFEYSLDPNITVAQNFSHSAESNYSAPNEHEVPSTSAVNKALNQVKSDLSSEIDSDVAALKTSVEKSIESVKANVHTNAVNISSINTKLTDINTIKEDIKELQKVTDPNSVDSLISQTTKDVDALQRNLESVQANITGIKAVTDQLSIPIPVSKGGTGVTSDAALKAKISGYGFLTSVNTQSAVETANRLATARTIRVYHYTSGAGNIFNSYITSASGAVSFNGSSDVAIGLNMGVYTNCNCNCNDDY